MGYCLTDQVSSDEATCWVCGCYYTLRFEPARSKESWGDRSSAVADIDGHPEHVAVYTAALPEPVYAF